MKIKLTDIPVYYINLEEDTHKKTSMQEILSDLGFSSINRFNAVKDPSNRHGCSLSHYELLSKLEKTEGPFIVLEDDLRLFEFVDELDIPDSADALYLGNSTYGLFGGKGIKKISAEKYNDNIYRIYNMLGAHAILYLNNDYIRNLLKMFEFDILIKDHHDKSRAASMKYYEIYALDTPMFYQYWYHESVTKARISEMQTVPKELSY